FYLFDGGQTLSGIRHREFDPCWHVIVSPAVQLPPGLALAYATPLLEEEGHLGLLALAANGLHPLLPHRAGAGTALPADDDPVDALQVELAEVFQEGLDRKEPHRRGCLAKVLD